MKKRSKMIILLLMIFVLGGCNSAINNASNSLKITLEDEKLIRDYLDTKTDDILKARYGKVYSAFDVLGTDKDRIYVWVHKEEYFKEGNSLVSEDAVAMPLVLYISIDKGLEINSHKGPEDGTGYGKSMRSLFPENIKNSINTDYNERASRLSEEAKSRAEEDFKNERQNIK